MSWVTVGVMAGGALLQSRSNEKKQDNQRRNNLAQAEVTRYSPWTHMQGQLDNSYVPGTEEGLIGGGIQGLGMAQSLKGAGMFGSKPTGPDMGYYNDITKMQGQAPGVAPAPMQQQSFWSGNNFGNYDPSKQRA